MGNGIKKRDGGKKACSRCGSVYQVTFIGDAYSGQARENSDAAHRIAPNTTSTFEANKMNRCTGKEKSLATPTGGGEGQDE